MVMKRLDVSIPDKLYFKIGEVSELLGLPSYVLRFWETEFKRIKPKRSSAGQRLYRKKDVEFILKVKYLLYEKGFTISGARQHLRKKHDILEDLPRTLSIKELRHELEQIRELLTS
jgi:DNA-binding transcriptional MerR regulator